MDKPKLSLVVPFYNEEKIIKKTLKILSLFLEKNFQGFFELIFVNDGSKDKSKEIIKKDLHKFPYLTLISYKNNRGRGYAVTKGFKEAKGEIIGFIDSDLEIQPRYISKCIKALKNSDVAVVSKYHPKSQITTTLFRKVMSKIFFYWVAFLLDPFLADHQGGLKIAKRRVIEKILPKIESRRWLFDLEFLYYSQQEGFTIQKIPIRVKYGFRKFSLNNISNFALDFLRSSVVIVRLRLQEISRKNYVFKN